MSEALIKQVKGDMDRRVHKKYPVGSLWKISIGEECIVWCDASSLSVNAAIEIDDGIVEDMSCLRPKGGGSHIKISELDCVLRVLNIALKWDWHLVEIRTDSVFVYRSIESIVSCDKRIKVKRILEGLVR